MQVYLGRTMSPWRQDFTALVGQAGEQVNGIYEADYRDFNRDTYVRGRQTFDTTYAGFKRLLFASWRRDELAGAGQARRRPPDGPPPPHPGRSDPVELTRLGPARARQMFRARNIPQGSALALPRPAAPIARVAAEAASAAALEEMAETLARARDEGRMVVDLGARRDRAGPSEPRPDPARGRGHGGPARVDPPARPAHPDRGDAAGGHRRRGRPALRADLRLAPARRVQGAACRDQGSALRQRPRAGLPPRDRGGRLCGDGRGERDPRRPQPVRARPGRRHRHRARHLRKREGGAACALRHREPRQALADPRLPRHLPRARRDFALSPGPARAPGAEAGGDGARGRARAHRPRHRPRRPPDARRPNWPP